MEAHSMLILSHNVKDFVTSSAGLRDLFPAKARGALEEGQGVQQPNRLTFKAQLLDPELTCQRRSKSPHSIRSHIY